MKADRPHRPLSCHRIAARAASALITVLLSSGLASPAVSGDAVTRRAKDPAVLSEMAADVLRRAGQRPPVSQETAGATLGTALADPDNASEPESPAAHGAAGEGITVPIAPGLRGPGLRGPKKDRAAEATGYQSNSWGQRSSSERALSFSSGVLAPAVGLDPALTARAEGLRREGREFVYGFLLLTARPDAALERTLAGLGVELLGPHDDHYKARLPVASLDALTALPEVEWIGLSAPEQKLSSELAQIRGLGATTEGVGGGTPIPITINLFEHDTTGDFRRQLEAAGAAVGEYDAGLFFYRAVATGPVIDRIAGLDFVLFVEPIGVSSAHHDQSTPLIDADIIRPGTTPLGFTRFSAATVTVGVMDTGFNIGGDPGAVAHRDLLKFGCGANFTTDSAGVFRDENGHGTHVLGTIGGDGSANPRYRGVATGIGTIDFIRFAKIWKKDGKGLNSWMENAMNYMSNPSECGSVRPEVINISGGSDGVGLVGTDPLARKLDEKVWLYGQLYVVSAGNEGAAGPQTIGTPGVAKSALTVGNVFDEGNLVGDVTLSSSRGPAGDGRMKPNVVAPGHTVTSAKAGSTSLYSDKTGTSMATPHVTGLAATLMDHYPYFRGRPALMRAHLMATAIAHDDVTQKSMEYGIGRVSGYVAHWDHTNNDGWHTYRYWGTATSHGFAYGDIVVPPNTQRLVVVMTWDEPPASAGASRAVTYDLDLWADLNIDCMEETGRCGEYVSQSAFDNTEYLVVNNPPAGSYRLKVYPHDAPSTFALRWGMTAVVIRGDPKPIMMTNVTAPATNPVVGTFFPVTVSVQTESYVTATVLAEAVTLSPGVTPSGAQTQRHDGAWATFQDRVTLGNVTPMLGRSAQFWYRADTPGVKSFIVNVWSENGGAVSLTKSVVVGSNLSDLAATGMGTSPSAPALAPGSSFTVTDTVQNFGVAPSGNFAMRYYLSLDAVKSSDDRQLSGSRGVTALAPGTGSSGSATVTIPAATPLNNYFLLVCADPQNAVEESDEGNNCIASPGPTVMVGRPDLVTSGLSDPPASKARGTSFSTGDTVQNVGTLASKAATTRYYLSLDRVKNQGDRLLNGSRSVPALQPGASHSSGATVTIPPTTPLNTYYLLACADNANGVAETNETNNCVASSTTVTLTP